MSEVNLLQKWELLQAIIQDPELPATSKLVAARLLDHHNNKTGQCNPSYTTLARGTGLGRRSVIDAVGPLEKRDWMAMQRTDGGTLGRGYDTNNFLMNFGRVSPGAKSALPPGAGNDTGPVQNLHPTGALFDTPPGAAFAPKHKKEEHAKEPGKRTRESTNTKTAADPAWEAAFERWYDTYPRHAAKERARRIYARILKTGAATIDELQAGAERYACQRAGQDPKYTPYPSTWLNDGCWKDESEPVVIQAAAPTAGAHSAVAGVFKGIDRGRTLDDEITDAAEQPIAAGRRRYLG